MPTQDFELSHFLLEIIAADLQSLCSLAHVPTMLLQGAQNEFAFTTPKIGVEAVGLACGLSAAREVDVEQIPGFDCSTTRDDTGAVYAMFRFARIASAW